MKKNIKAGLVASIVATVMILTGCTNNDTTDTNQNGNEVTEVINTYTEVVNTAYNHNKSPEELEEVNTNVSAALGDTGSDYEAALTVLEPVISLDNIYVGDNSPTSKIVGAMSVLNIMLSNTVNDVVSVKVDPNDVTLSEDGTNAEIAYSGITFSSEQNSTTGLADSLNALYATGEGSVKLFLVNGGWKVDMSTFQPSVKVSE